MHLAAIQPKVLFLNYVQYSMLYDFCWSIVIWPWAQWLVVLCTQNVDKLPGMLLTESDEGTMNIVVARPIKFEKHALIGCFWWEVATMYEAMHSILLCALLLTSRWSLPFSSLACHRGYQYCLKVLENSFVCVMMFSSEKFVAVILTQFGISRTKLNTQCCRAALSLRWCVVLPREKL